MLIDDTKLRVRALLDESARLNANAADLYVRAEAAQAAADRLENAAYDLEDRYEA